MLHSGNEEIDRLLHDDYFIRWVISPDKVSDEYWQAWQRQDPARKTVLGDAKKIVRSIYHHEKLLAGALDQGLIHEAWAEINRQLQEKRTEPSPVRGISRWLKYAVAASVLAIAGTIFFRTQHPRTVPAVALHVNRVAAGDSVSAEIQLNNTTDARRLINLPDGSRIILSKNSSLRYARLFNRQKREVFLTGNAFFEVAKNAQRPFYVYSGNVVTKVLGTSFRIISDDRRGKVTVAVRSGEVKVFRQNDARHQQDQYLLIRNEQLIFRDKEARPVKASVQNEIIPVNEMPAALNFSFDAASLSEILLALEKTYQIDIVYDRTRSEKCRITVALDGQSLYDKLDLLCKVTGATYRTEGGKIYLDGTGCN